MNRRCTKGIILAALTAGISLRSNSAEARPEGSPSPTGSAREHAQNAGETGAATPSGEKPEEPSKVPLAFQKGRFTAPLVLGAAFAGDRDYLIAGGGLGYYVIDGLEVGLDVAFWILDSPVMLTLTPQARYVAHFVPVVKPYAGGFLRHYIAGSNVSDFQSIGFRFGVAIPMNEDKNYLGIGALYERLFSCDKFNSCGDLYPELTYAFSF